MPINSVRSFVMGSRMHPAVLAGDQAAPDRRGNDGRQDGSHDSVRLSSLSGDLAAIAGRKPREDVLDIVSTQVAELRTRLMDELARKMREAGLDPEVKVSLRLDDQGKVRAAGGKPETAQVERFFAEDESLSKLFRELAAHSDLLRSLRAARGGHVRSASGYQAYTRAATELDSSPVAFVLTLLGSQATTYHDRQN